MIRGAGSHQKRSCKLKNLTGLMSIDAPATWAGEARGSRAVKSDGSLHRPDFLLPVPGASGRREFAIRTRRNVRSISHGKSLLSQLKPFRHREPHGSKDISSLFQMPLYLHKSTNNRKKERESRMPIYPGQLEDAYLGLEWTDLRRGILPLSTPAHPQYNHSVSFRLLNGSQR